MVDKKKIGSFLTGRRKEKKLKQSELAEVLGVSNKSISRWERGETLPDYDQVLRLCQALEISVYDFISGESGAEERFAVRPRAHAVKKRSPKAE